MSGIPWTQVGLVLASLLTLVGGIYTARTSRLSARRSANDDFVVKVWAHMEEMQDRLDADRDRMDTMQAEIDALRAGKTAQDGLIVVHRSWDATACDELRRRGVIVPPPPPLLAQD